MRSIFLYIFIWFLPVCAFSQAVEIDAFKNPENTNLENLISFSSIINNRIVYLRGSDNGYKTVLYSADLDGKNRQELINQDYLQSFYKSGNLIYFITYNDSLNSHFLWRTDGTTNGTKQINQISIYNNYQRPSILAESQHILYFTGNDQNKNKQLWRSDGTESGTFVLKTFKAETSVGNFSINGKDIFFAINEGKKFELWHTDGSINGTSQLKDLNYNLPITFLNNIMLYAGYSENEGYELWRSDGTEAGTYLLKDFVTGYDSVYKQQKSSNPDIFGVLDGKAYFYYHNQSFGYTFGVTDGTKEGTRLLIEFNNTHWHNYIYLKKVFLLNNKIGFYASTDSVGFEFYFSDTSSQSIFEPIDIWKGFGSGTNLVYYTERVTEKIEGKLHYFYGNNGETGNELWRTDGTKAGTYMIAEEIPGMRKSNYHILYQNDDTLIYTFSKDETLHLQLILNAQKLQPKKYTYSGNGVTWFRTFGADGFNSTSSYYINSNVLKLDNSNNVLVLGSLQSSVLRFYDTSLKVLGPDFGAHYNAFNFITKYNSNGKLLWAKQIGGEAMSREADLVTDKSNNIYVAGCFQEKAIIDNELIESPRNSIYLTKLNADGKKIWHTIAFARGSMNTEKLLLHDNKLIMAGTYKDFISYWPNFVLASDSSPAYFVTAYDTSGKMLWSRNLHIDWNWVGPINAIKAGKDGKNYVMISMGSRNTWSSCRYNNWYFKIFCLNPETGITEWEKIFESSDLMTASTMEINSYGELMIAGNFRGELYADDLTLKTDKTENCNLVSSFFLRLDNMGNMLSGYTENPAFTDIYDLFAMPDGTYYETGIRKVKGNYNSYPRYENQTPSAYQRTYIRHRSTTGKLLAEREFYKGGSESFEHQPRVVADNDNNVYFSDIYSYALDTISQAYTGNSNYNIYLVKFPLGQKYYESPAQTSENNLVTLGPNPTQNYLYINSTKNTFIHYNISLYNTLGQQIIQTQKTDDLQSYRLDMSHLSPGVYILQLANGADKVSRKVVKY